MKSATGKTLLMTAALLGAPFHSRADAICTWLNALAGNSDATLVQNSKGSLYGTTVGTGVLRSFGTVFEATTNGPVDSFPGLTSGLTNIFVFPSGDAPLANLGEKPNAGVILGPGGSIIGTTAFSGNSNTLFPAGMGCAFGFFTNGATPRYYHFGSALNTEHQPLDGASPRSTLAVASNNYLYGTTYEGGSNGYAAGGLGYGTVFKLSTNGFALTELHSFTGSDGANPTGLTFGADGNLYGVAGFGGSNTTVVETNGKTGFGVIYKITTNGVLTVLYSFGAITNTAGNALDGSQPNSLLLAADGNFYGTTTYGGSNTTVADSNLDVGYGTFFRISTNGELTTLYSFGAVTNADGVPLDGANPSGPLAVGLDGNFYGVTQFGGPTNTGTVYRMTPQGMLTTLHTFGTNFPSKFPQIPPPLAPQTGEYPRGGLLLVANGNFYGTTFTGGPEEGDTGAIFRLGPAVPDFSNAPANATILAGAGKNFTAQVNSLYETSCQWQFDTTNLTDGGNISGSATSNLTITAATMANAGTYTLIASNVAGMASVSAQLAVVPAIIVRQPASATVLEGASYTFSVTVDSIYSPSFQWLCDSTNLSDGGDIAGSATSGLAISGASAADDGTYALIISNAAGIVQSFGAVLTVKPFFVLQPPFGLTLLAGSSGSFTVDIESDFPVSYQWQLDETNLMDGPDFSGSATSNLTVTAATPAEAGVYTVAASSAAGSTNFSVLLTVITPMATGVALSNLYSFSGGHDGLYPEAALLQASNGLFYGTTEAGGAYGEGTVFVTSGDGALATLYAFGTNATDGSYPLAALIQGADGNLYGTTYDGGTNGSGTVFSLTPSGNVATLLSFAFASGDLQAGLVQDGAGLFYGGTLAGDLFQITASGVTTPLYQLADLEGASATLLLATDGNLYGVSSYGGAGSSGGASGYGSVFEVTTNGTFTSLYSFTGGADGEYPAAPLVQGNDGAFYGTARNGGARGDGTVFRLTTNGTFALLYSFGTVTNWDGSAQDGAQPNGLLLGNDGNFYGTTASGGYNSDGTIFRLTPGGQFTTLVFFEGANGLNPLAALVQGSDGYYYGTTANGGSNNAGTIFKMSVPPGVTAASQSNGVVSFGFSALLGQTYQLQYTPSLSPPLWQNVGSPIQASSPTLAFTDAILPGQRFYRVVLLPSP